MLNFLANVIEQSYTNFFRYILLYQTVLTRSYIFKTKIEFNRLACIADYHLIERPTMLKFIA